jgi:hypothetical protein
VTATSIKLGVAYVDLAAIHQLLGITYDEGSYPDAYQALVNNINSHGGINGRKIQLVTTAVSPIGTAADACVHSVDRRRQGVRRNLVSAAQPPVLHPNPLNPR